MLLILVLFFGIVGKIPDTYARRRVDLRRGQLTATRQHRHVLRTGGRRRSHSSRRSSSL
jgi:hypothetical protein